MDQIVSNPGLQHIAEKIFLTLNYEDILSCRLLNKSSNLILENPILWLGQGILKGLSKKNQGDWLNVIKLTKDTKLESNITKYLRRVAKKSFFVDVPCFINQNVLEVFLNTDFEIPICLYTKYYSAFEVTTSNTDDYGEIQLMSTFIKNPNAPIPYPSVDRTPIKSVACTGNVEMVKILAPLISDPKNAYTWLESEFFLIIAWGHTEVVQILSQLCANPNPQMMQILKSSIEYATRIGRYDIVAVLKQYVE